MKEMTVKLYCDGGCRGNGRKDSIGGWAFVVMLNDTVVFEDSGATTGVTNNSMELLALINGLRHLLPEKDEYIEVYSDSKYVISGVIKGVKKWAKAGWRTQAGTPVANEELWRLLLSLVQQFSNIHFNLVRGHSGVRGNEMCDSLANRAMDDFIAYKDFIRG